jgi:hypothetical protein
VDEVGAVFRGGRRSSAGLGTPGIHGGSFYRVAARAPFPHVMA